MSNGNSSSSASGGIGFTGLLQVAFIVLKLTHVIGWSWLWVLAPAWISIGIVVLIVGGIVSAAVISVALGRKRKRARAVRRG